MAGTSHVAYLTVRSLLRSINFFSLALGFEVIRDARREMLPHVVMSARGCSQLVLRTRHLRPCGPIRAASEAVVVTDLDQAHARIWEAGAVVVRDGTSPRIYAPSERRRLYLRDPDGNEIELSEATPPAGVTCSALDAGVAFLAGQ